MLKSLQNRNINYSLDLSKILVFSIIFSLFIDINFFSFGSFIISTKLLSTILGVMIMSFDLKTININFDLIKYGFLFYLIFNISQLMNGAFNIPSLIYFLSYSFFFTILLDYLNHKKLNKFFFTSFIYVSTIMSVIAFLQVFNILPTPQSNINNIVLDAYSLNQGDILNSRYQRGTGLMFDSNFFAMFLALGFAMNRFILRSLPISTIILVGILSTFSRSAILAVIFSYLFTMNTSKWTLNRFFKGIIFLIITILFLLFISINFPSSIFSYFINRLIELYDVIFSFNISPNLNLLESSTSVRFFSYLAAYYIFLNNPIVGTGIDGSRVAFQEYLGMNTVAHNTFLEFFVVAGIFGIIPTIIFLRVFFMKSQLSNQYLGLFRSMSGALFVSFMTLTHMQSLLIFYPLFLKKLTSIIQDNNE